VVQNGMHREFNRQLREQLQAAGVVFRLRDRYEVIPHLIAQRLGEL